MQYRWLEKLAEDGAIRPEAKQMIYRDCSAALVKCADGGEGFMEMLKKNLPTIATSMTIAALPAVIKGVSSAIEPHATASSAIAIRNSILKDKDFAAYPEKADARYRELVAIAPHVALNRQLAKRVVAASLHTGLSDEDVRHLTSLQAQYSKNPTAPSHISGLMKNKIDSEGTQKKASVRPEKVGEIYADVCSLLKFAEFGPKAKAVGEVLKTVALVTGVPILSGLATGAAFQLTSSRKNKKLQEALQNSFATAMRQSDPTREPLHANKDKAQQAFMTLAHFAPHVAVQPQAARSFMNRLVGSDIGVDVTDVKSLTEIEKNIATIAPAQSAFLAGALTGVTAAGLPEIVQRSTQSVLEPVTLKARADLAHGLKIPGWQGIHTKAGPGAPGYIPDRPGKNSAFDWLGHRTFREEK